MDWLTDEQTDCSKGYRRSRSLSPATRAPEPRAESQPCPWDAIIERSDVWQCLNSSYLHSFKQILQHWCTFLPDQSNCYNNLTASPGHVAVWGLTGAGVHLEVAAGDHKVRVRGSDSRTELGGLDLRIKSVTSGEEWWRNLELLWPRVVRQPWILHDIQEMFVVFSVDLVDD